MSLGPSTRSAHLPVALLSTLLSLPLAGAASAQVLSQQIVREADLPGAAGGLPRRFGRVATLGDLDGDGLPELAVGAPDDDDGGTRRGAVWVLFLRPDGSVRTSQKISALQGGFAGALDDLDGFGASVVGLGDLDGDGVPDLAAGAPGDDDGQHVLRPGELGAVWILFLNPDGTVRAHQKISAARGSFAGPLAESDGFGSALATVGDLDGDGLPELSVGSPGDDLGQGTAVDLGAVWILFLDAAGRVRAETRIGDDAGGLRGTLVSGGAFGAGLSSLGDLDGNGVSDLAVGAPGPLGGTAPGEVWLLFLQADGTVTSEHRIRSGSLGFAPLEADDGFGTALSLAGDLDGDGTVELLAGAPGDDDGARNEGAVWILSLRADGSVAETRKLSSTRGAFRSDGSAERFGSGVAALGDLDGDGVPELAVGGGGVDRVWILSWVPCALAPAAPFTRLSGTISVSSGGAQTQCLDAGPVLAGRTVLVLGSMTGTSPGFDLGGVHVPLVPDAYTDLTLRAAGSQAFRGFAGVLDEEGRAVSQLRVPRLPAALAGLRLHHAFVVLGPTGALVGASNPIAVTLVP